MFSFATVGDGLASDPHVERFGAQPRTLAVRAFGVAPIAAQKDAHMDFVFLRFHFREEVVDRLHHQRLLLRCQIAVRHIPSHFTARGFLELRAEPLVLRLGPGIDCAFVERQAGVGNHQVHVVVDGVSEALAARACAHRIVEAEEAGLRRHQLDAAALAGELFAESRTWRGRILRRGFFKDHFAALRDNRFPWYPRCAGAGRAR